ncbi:hypothetical protein Rhal01_01532 [Rubritalea halochordaticola]|uniref:Uncharacterized protein n=1 Tax=Rubritalea halochordaticola TaxID=714537 RepID=A0ABP9UYB0_9BACT
MVWVYDSVSIGGLMVLIEKMNDVGVWRGVVFAIKFVLKRPDRMS